MKITAATVYTPQGPVDHELNHKDVSSIEDVTCNGVPRLRVTDDYGAVLEFVGAPFMAAGMKDGEAGQ